MSLPELLRDPAILAVSYGCKEYVRSEILVVARLSGGNFIRQHPSLLLEIVCLWEDEELYVDALRHEAGQRAARIADTSTLPDDIATIVENHARSITARVEKVCHELVLPSNHVENLPSFLTRAIFQHHLLSRVFRTKAAGQDRFHELSYIKNMRSALDLLGSDQAASILQSVDFVHLGLIEGTQRTRLCQRRPTRPKSARTLRFGCGF